MGDSAWSRRNREAVAAGLEGAPMSAARAQTYVVQSGDTLWEIAYERNLSVETLLRFNTKLDADFIRPGDRVHLPSSEELLRNMKRRLPPPQPAPQPAQEAEEDDEEEDEVINDEGDWPPPGSKVHRAIMERHTTEKPSPIVVVAGTVAVAVAIRVLARVLRKNGTASPPSDEITPVKPAAVRGGRRKPIGNVMGAVGKCAAFVKDTVGKVLVLETESGSPPATPALPPHKAPAPAPVFRDDPRHSAREESSSPGYSAGSVFSDASARSSASNAPSMADILLVVKRAGGGENLTVRSTTRDVAVEIERALVRLARDKTRERERFDRTTATSAPKPAQGAAASAGAAERAALQQELQAALTAVAAFKEAETIQAAMAAEANARCAALEITLAEERAKEREREREKAAKGATHEATAFQSPPAAAKTAAPESPVSDAGSPGAEAGRAALGNGGAFRVPVGGVRSPAAESPRTSSLGCALTRGAYGGGALSTSGGAAAAEAEVMRQAEDRVATIHASAALQAMTAAVEALDAAMVFDSTSPEAKETRDVTVKVRQQGWSVSQSNQSMRYTAAESSSSSRSGGVSQDTPGTPPLDSDTLSPQSMLRQPEGESPAVPSPPLPRMSSGYGGTMAYKASLRGASGDSRGGSSIYDPSPRFSYT